MRRVRSARGRLSLFRGELNLAPWLRRYLKTRDAVDTPGQIVTAAGENYEL
jgi:hypothetical protein